MDWSPEPGETPLFHGTVKFAVGRAPLVVDRHWFRDEQGREISGELPGWPQAPVAVKRGEKTAKAGRSLGILGKATAFVAAAAFEAVTPGGSNVNLQGSDGATPADPALEVEDFPVMMAPAGTIARTVPFQLDSARRPDKLRNRTDLQLTDRRLIILGFDSGKSPGVVLWSLPLSQVAGARQHAFSTTGADVTVTFADGSWIRLDLATKTSAAKVVTVLNGQTRPVLMNPAQQAAAESFTRLLPKPLEFVVLAVDGAPGTITVEAKWPVRNGLMSSGAVSFDAEGKPVTLDDEGRPKPVS